MKTGLATRIQDIPGVAEVVIDADGNGRGIDVRLEPGANEADVLAEMRRLLATYGLRRDLEPDVMVGRRRSQETSQNVVVKVTPVGSGARIEVANAIVRSFRMVAADPFSVAQGLADAWCQVVGREPVQVQQLHIAEDELALTIRDGDEEKSAGHSYHGSWHEALVGAVAEVLSDDGAPGIRRVAS